MEVMEQLGITLGAYHGMVDHILTESGQLRSGLQPADITKATDTAIEVYQATAFLLGSDCYRFGKLINELQNYYYAMGVDKDPKTLQEAYHILNHYKFDAQNYQSPTNNNIGVMALIDNGHGIKKDYTKIPL